MIVVMLMVLTVNILLLFAADRLLGANTGLLRILAGATLGVAFAGLSMISGFAFLKHYLWRLCALVLSACMAYGFSRRTVPRLLLYLLLQLSLGGITGSAEEMPSMALGAAGICFACLTVGKRQVVIPVELTYGTQTVHITALRDTGNALRDPITGKQVLVVDADVAQKLTGLTPAQLADPVGTIGRVPGLRLIPYQTVGNTGFLLALPVSNAKIGSRQGSTLVAFSPLTFHHHYQALTGGTL